MELINALNHRRSIRHFQSIPIPSSVMGRVLNQALKAPSSSNAQPYRLAVASGSVRRAISDELCERFDRANRVSRMPLPLKLWHGVTGKVLPDGDYNPNVKYPGELYQRKFECGMGLYETLGIDREDYAARDRQMRRNFEFFGAPTVIFVYVHDKLGRYSALDAGIFLQSLMLAALEEGLGTCTQAALAIWGSPIRERFQIEADYKLLCGVSIGYPAEHPVNEYRPVRRDVVDIQLRLRSPASRASG